MFGRIQQHAFPYNGSKKFSLWHFYCLQRKSISQIVPEMFPVVSFPHGHILGKVCVFFFFLLWFSSSIIFVDVFKSPNIKECYPITSVIATPLKSSLHVCMSLVISGDGSNSLKHTLLKKISTKHMLARISVIWGLASTLLSFTTCHILNFPESIIETKNPYRILVYVLCTSWDTLQAWSQTPLATILLNKRIYAGMLISRKWSTTKRAEPPSIAS